MTALSLTTARLSLRPFSSGDLEDLFRLYGDPQVMEIRKLGVQTYEQTGPLLEEMVVQWTERGFGMSAVFEHGSGAFLGECGLRPVGPKDPAIELSYGLLPQFWGRGYAPEASAAVLGFGFASAGLDEIVALARADNTRSRRVLERLGLRLVRKTGDGHAGTVRYAVAAEAWRSRQVKVP